MRETCRARRHYGFLRKLILGKQLVFWELVLRKFLLRNYHRYINWYSNWFYRQLLRYDHYP
jgi:hypothetical protein